MVKIVLLSQYPLPYTKIGSWQKMFDYFLVKNKGVIDYLVCPILECEPHKDLNYFLINRSLFPRIMRFLTGYSKLAYIKQIKKVLDNESKLVINIIDNFGLLFELHKYLVKNQLRNRVRIIFFIHGYSYFFDSKKSEIFYDSIDHMVFLSEASYRFELSRTHSISSKVSILPNGIDLIKFFPIEDSLKEKLKLKYSVSDKTIFLWCSNDRPKKGLHIIIEAWKKSSLFKNTKYELLIIGFSGIYNDENIKYLGKIEHDLLFQYYQISDIYLFTTLCHEGFPLSLSEALATGLKTVVSDIAPLREIFNRFGNITFVENPHYVDSWLKVLEKISLSKVKYENFDRETFFSEISIDLWSNRLKEILNSEVNLIRN